jgi:F-type H+-transporting ATPase subunit epsilon
VQAYAVTGGFAEIAAGAVTVLAERAIPLADVTSALLDGFIAEARSRLDDAPADRASAEKTLADMIALKASIAA